MASSLETILCRSMGLSELWPARVCVSSPCSRSGSKRGHGGGRERARLSTGHSFLRPPPGRGCPGVSQAVLGTGYNGDQNRCPCLEGAEQPQAGTQVITSSHLPVL